MPMQATLSLYGLYQYDNTLLDGLKAAVPNGVDADNVADTLLLESAGLEILYSNPVFMKAAVTVWANENRDIWQKLYDTTLLEYNPIDNYDRYETSTREITGTGETGSTSSTVVDGTTGNTETVEYSGTNSGTNSTTNSNTSYDSDTLKVTGKADTTGSNTDTRTTETTASTDTDSTTTDTTSGTSEFSNTDSFTSHIHGNIGVTTAMKMISEQRDVVQFCLTEFICNEFLDKFTVGVY